MMIDQEILWNHRLGFRLYVQNHQIFMKNFFFTLLLCLGCAVAQGQNYTSMVYTTTTVTTSYGSSVNFAGNVLSHSMDISYPTNDVPPPSGRPLMLLIHGGSFLSGTKNDGDIQNMRLDFAKRGYVTASIDYRLGFFQTVSNWHCNLPGWDCFNASDTTEWIRACYRGIQDAHGAIRYLVNNASTYNIDPNKVFVVGQSAGAFIALGVGFMDHASEIPYGVGALPNAPTPNAIYNSCSYTDNPLSLARPDLGSYTGTMNLPSAPYRILGVGDIYGAIFKNLFLVNANNSQIPCLYMYHRSNDILVPSGRDRALAKYSYCASSGFGCSPVLNRPYVSGAFHMKTLIDQLAAQNLPRPQYQADLVTVNISCDLYSHSIDNYSLRTGNMASFFAPRILNPSKAAGNSSQSLLESEIQLYPNPTSGKFTMTLPEGLHPRSISLVDLMGKEVYSSAVSDRTFSVEVPSGIARGIYLIHLSTSEGKFTRRVVLE